MYLRSFATGLMIALAIAVAACSGARVSSVTAGRDMDADVTAIFALLATNEAATNRRDAAGVAATFVPAGRLWIAGGSVFLGLDAIRRNEEDFYSMPGFQAWHAVILSIQFVRLDVALVESADVTTLDSGEIRARSIWIVSRQNGDWRFVAVRVINIDEQPEIPY